MQQSILCAATALALCIASGVHANAEQQRPLPLNRPIQMEGGTRFIDACPKWGGCGANWRTNYEIRAGRSAWGINSSPKKNDYVPGRSNSNQLGRKPGELATEFNKRKHDADVAQGKAARNIGGYSHPENEQLSKIPPKQLPCYPNCTPGLSGNLLNSSSQSKGNAAMDRLNGM